MSNDEFSYRDNAFDLLKIIAAYIVMMSHSFRLFEVDKPVWSLFFTDGATGVMIFYVITGFCIMGSWERMCEGRAVYWKFIFNRIIRLYPPLIVSFFVISFINIFLYSIDVLSKNYFIYMIKYLLFFRGGGYNAIGVSNGVLWSILPIVFFYIITPMVYRLRNQRNYVWIICILLLWCINIYDYQIINILKEIPWLGRAVGIDFPFCFMYEFMIGSFLYFKRNEIIVFFVHNKSFAFIWLVVFVCFFELYTYFDVIPKTGEMHTPWLGMLCCPLIIIFSFIIGKCVINPELSYSIFLYHMVIISIIKHFNISGLEGIAITLFITPLFAFISRRLIEEPMLRYKI